MFRDFSDEAKERLLSYVDEVTPVGTWNSIVDCISDWGLTVQEWIGKLSINNYINNLKEYHTQIIDKNDTSSQQIEQIFADVYAVDSKYSTIISEAVSTGRQLVKYINDMADGIDPSGGQFTVEHIEGVLGIDKANMEENQIDLVHALSDGEQIDIATAYMDAAAGLDLTYEDFLQLTEEQQQAYINQAGKYIFSLYPTIELEAGVYEITVPIGVDMTATYSVTVTGTVGSADEETVALTIEQQQVVLESIELSDGSASVSVDEDGINGSLDFGEGGFSIEQSMAGKTSLETCVTTGKTETTLSVESMGNTVSVIYKVETEIEENLSVSSALSVSKSDNTNIPQWEPVLEPALEPIIPAYEMPDLGYAWQPAPYMDSNGNGLESYGDYTYGMPVNTGVSVGLTTTEILAILLLLLVPVP